MGRGSLRVLLLLEAVLVGHVMCAYLDDGVQPLEEVGDDGLASSAMGAAVMESNPTLMEHSALAKRVAAGDLTESERHVLNKAAWREFEDTAGSAVKMEGAVEKQLLAARKNEAFGAKAEAHAQRILDEDTKQLGESEASVQTQEEELAAAERNAPHLEEEEEDEDENEEDLGESQDPDGEGGEAELSKEDPLKQDQDQAQDQDQDQDQPADTAQSDKSPEDDASAEPETETKTVKELVKNPRYVKVFENAHTKMDTALQGKETELVKEHMAAAEKAVLAARDEPAMVDKLLAQNYTAEIKADEDAANAARRKEQKAENAMGHAMGPLMEANRKLREFEAAAANTTAIAAKAQKRATLLKDELSDAQADLRKPHAPFEARGTADVQAHVRSYTKAHADAEAKANEAKRKYAIEEANSPEHEDRFKQILVEETKNGIRNSLQKAPMQLPLHTATPLFPQQPANEAPAEEPTEAPDAPAEKAPAPAEIPENEAAEEEDKKEPDPEGKEDAKQEQVATQNEEEMKQIAQSDKDAVAAEEKAKQETDKAVEGPSKEEENQAAADAEAKKVAKEAEEEAAKEAKDAKDAEPSKEAQEEKKEAEVAKATDAAAKEAAAKDPAEPAETAAKEADAEEAAAPTEESAEKTAETEAEAKDPADSAKEAAADSKNGGEPKADDMTEKAEEAAKEIAKEVGPAVALLQEDDSSAETEAAEIAEEAFNWEQKSQDDHDTAAIEKAMQDKKVQDFARGERQLKMSRMAEKAYKTRQLDLQNKAIVAKQQDQEAWEIAAKAYRAQQRMREASAARYGDESAAEEDLGEDSSVEPMKVYPRAAAMKEYAAFVKADAEESQNEV